MRFVSVFALVGIMLLASCTSTPTVTPFAATLPSNALASAERVVAASTLIPTANLQPTRTRTLFPTNTLTPSHTYTPSITPSPTYTPSSTLTPSITPSPTFTITPSPTLTLTPIPSATPYPTTTPIASATPTSPLEDPNSTPLPTWTPPPPDPSTQINDHYVFGRPISPNGTNWVDRNYPYGNTRGGQLQIHHGVEFINGTGTPIRAVGDGVVFYAGGDQAVQFGSMLDYYGNLVVIQHPVTDTSGQPVFTLYGHMSRVEVATGQSVSAGDEIGIVGATGVALGPHLHLEVRVGDPYNFDGTRNPELWIRPFGGFGTLAGRVTDSAGNILYDVSMTIQSQNITRYAFSYAGTEVNGDSVFGENFTLGDLPADWYTVTVGEGGRVRFRQLIYVYPNRTTWLNVTLN